MNLKFDPKNTSILSRVTGVLFLAVAATVSVHEGRSLTEYKDAAGVPTICDGETKNVGIGETRTAAQCDATLKASITEHAKALVGLPSGLPDGVVLGSLDAAYNIGVDAFRNSKVYQDLLLRDYDQAGQDILEFKFITKTSTKSPGTSWVLVSKNRWRFNCSRVVEGVPNTVCYGLWKRRLWESKAISNDFESADDAVRNLP